MDIFGFDDVAKSCPVSYRAINQYGGTTCRPSFSRVNPDAIGCMWTGEFDLNKLRMDGEIFESGRKKLWIQKYLDTCRWDIKVPKLTCPKYENTGFVISTQFAAGTSLVKKNTLNIIF